MNQKFTATIIIISVLLLIMVQSVHVLSAQGNVLETITPNKLTIEWFNGIRNPVEINTFRIRGYNIAQLRDLVSVCGGTVMQWRDGTYQVMKSNENPIGFTTINFSEKTTVNIQFNVTPIRDSQGALMTPSQPGWVYLPDYQ